MTFIKSNIGGSRVFFSFFKMELEREEKDLLPCVAKWQLEMACLSLNEREREREQGGQTVYFTGTQYALKD